MSALSDRTLTKKISLSNALKALTRIECEIHVVRMQSNLHHLEALDELRMAEYSISAARAFIRDLIKDKS